jgi:hypothetical protein
VHTMAAHRRERGTLRLMADLGALERLLREPCCRGFTRLERTLGQGFAVRALTVANTGEAQARC